MEYGQLIKKEREKQGLSLAQLSNLSGISITTIHNWERGTAPAIDKYDQVLKALGISIQLGAGPDKTKA